MSLYFAVFTENDEELNGFQVGTYHDYGKFIETVKENIESNFCSVLINHHDSDGCWSAQECKVLIKELSHIKNELAKLPPNRIDYDWAKQNAYELGDSLNSSLQNVDGEPMANALLSLCELAVKNNAKLYFQ